MINLTKSLKNKEFVFIIYISLHIVVGKKWINEVNIMKRRNRIISVLMAGCMAASVFSFAPGVFAQSQASVQKVQTENESAEKATAAVQKRQNLWKQKKIKLQIQKH